MEQKDDKRLYSYPDESRMEVVKFLTSMNQEKLIEFTAITRHSSIYLACMMGLNDLRQWMIATLEVNKLRDTEEDISEELEKAIKPFFLSDRILDYYLRLQKSVGGFNIQEMYKMGQTQMEGGAEEDILGGVDQKLFGDL